MPDGMRAEIDLPAAPVAPWRCRCGETSAPPAFAIPKRQKGDPVADAAPCSPHALEGSGCLAPADQAEGGR